MVTWLSLDDLVELLRCSLLTPRVRHASHLCYAPKDSSSQFAGKLPAFEGYPPADDITTFYQGGVFLTHGPKYKA